MSFSYAPSNSPLEETTFTSRRSAWRENLYPLDLSRDTVGWKVYGVGAKGWIIACMDEVYGCCLKSQALSELCELLWLYTAFSSATGAAALLFSCLIRRKQVYWFCTVSEPRWMNASENNKWFSLGRNS